MREPVKGYYRFPSIHNNVIIFTAEGDLWRVPADGGIAQRLTTHHGVEQRASISPDGLMVAFSAQYEGPTEVYVMPVHGGRPLRLTYEDEEALVVGWTPDQKIIYSSRRYSTLPSTQLCTIDPQSLEQAVLPLAEASDGTFDEAQKTLFFTRLPFQGSHTKRYKGGTVQTIWKHVKNKEAVPLTADFPGTSKTPMLCNGRIYFATDRDGTMNLWSMTKNGKRLKQHTFHKGFDIQDPQAHTGRIVYQWQADIYIFDAEKDTATLVDISLASDFDQKRERWVYNPVHYLDAWYPSPTGDRVVFTTRGKLFVAPVENGRFIELTPHNNGRYRSAQFTPDGESVFAYADDTGELEIYTMPATGLGERTQLTEGADTFRYQSAMSPDGNWIAFADKNNKLWLTDIEKKETALIAESPNTRFFDLTWAPDSYWLAFVEIADNSHAQIKVVNVDEREITAVTSDRVISFSPAWSWDGRWLYFLSDRHFESIVPSPWGARQPEPYHATTTKIYALSLQAGNASPFLPPTELDFEKQRAEDAERKRQAEKAKTAVEVEKVDKEAEKKEADSPKKEEKRTINIAFDHLDRRLYELPVEPGNHRDLTITEKHLYWIDAIKDGKSKYHLFAMPIDHKEPKPTRIISDIQSYDITLSGKKILIRQKQSFFIIEATGKPPKPDDKKRINLTKWRFAVDLRKEWQQMFKEAWRLERDFFYDPNLHGIDWQGLFDKHYPLLDRITDRDEFNHLLAQMVGELSALHTFVYAGDKRAGRDRIFSGALGARLLRDEAAGGYRIEHLFLSDPDYPNHAGPLMQPDSQVKVGDVIEAINGRSLLSVPHPAILLQNQIGQQVRLQMKTAVSAKESSKKKKTNPTYETYETIIKPMSPAQERELRYEEWEYTRRLQVEQASENKIGYLHLRAMSGGNYSEWTRNFYPVFNRQGLILDVRHNRGGNIDSWILSRLLRQVWFYWAPRKGQTYWNMHYAFRGHIVVLVNGRTASDGEAFADGFRRLGLGKVIGTRTWGGEIWLSRNTFLADKGIATAAQTGVFMDGEWLIEGHGLDPDIVVDNLPHSTFKGEDAQLDAAIQHLQALIKEDPRPLPEIPPYPNKSFDYGLE